MSTLCNINFKQGNRTESRQESQAEIKVLTEGISVKTTLTIDVSTNKTWNNIRNCYCNHPANITSFSNLTLLWSVSCVRGFSNADVCGCIPRFTYRLFLLYTLWIIQCLLPSPVQPLDAKLPTWQCSTQNGEHVTIMSQAN